MGTTNGGGHCSYMTKPQNPLFNKSISNINIVNK